MTTTIWLSEVSALIDENKFMTSKQALGRIQKRCETTRGSKRVDGGGVAKCDDMAIEDAIRLFLSIDDDNKENEAVEEACTQVPVSSSSSRRRKHDTYDNNKLTVNRAITSVITLSGKVDVDDQSGEVLLVKRRQKRLWRRIWPNDMSTCQAILWLTQREELTFIEEIQRSRRRRYAVTAYEDDDDVCDSGDSSCSSDNSGGEDDECYVQTVRANKEIMDKVINKLRCVVEAKFGSSSSVTTTRQEEEQEQEPEEETISDDTEDDDETKVTVVVVDVMDSKIHELGAGGNEVSQEISTMC
jgi:hypothetical protein